MKYTVTFAGILHGKTNAEVHLAPPKGPATVVLVPRAELDEWAPFLGKAISLVPSR
jgi:hypothetical protein